jgi:hypothetical protein
LVALGTAIFPYRKALFADTRPSIKVADRWIRAKTGVARISVGPTAFRVLMGDLERRAKLLAGGDVAGFTG